MIDVLIVAGQFPAQPTVLAEHLRQFQQRDARVFFACHFDTGGLAPDIAVAELYQMPGAAQRGRIGRDVRPSARDIWLRARRDRWIRQRARKAHVLVALDSVAVHTVWQLAQRNRAADAVLGLVPALKAVDARRSRQNRYSLRTMLRPVPTVAGIKSEARRRAISMARRAVGTASSPMVMRTGLGTRLWHAAVRTPGIPDRIRVELANSARRGMIKAGRAAAAASAAAAAAARVSSNQHRLALLTEAVNAELAAGRVPANLMSVCSESLAVADQRLAQGNKRGAAKKLAEVLPLVFNRVIHFDRLTSPLAEHPEEFIAPLYRSSTFRAATAPRHRRMVADHPTDRPLRLLFATLVNANFLGEIRQRYADMPGVDVRFLDLAEGPGRSADVRDPERIIEYALTGQSECADLVEEWLRPHLNWADTLFIDWCMSPAALFTMLDPGDTRVIVRLHSMEAFTQWPHLTDFSRVDDLVFVSAHLRDLTVAVTPALQSGLAPNMHVIANAMELGRYPRVKPAESRFNLGLIGLSSIAKDPRWALEVLRLLRRRDARYRLLLVGSDLNAKASAAAKRYHGLLSQDLAELEPTGAVRRLGHTDDVPAALTEIGVIISSSVRESFHCALVEGAASGAVPVVRNWPYFADNTNGAHTLFPTEWVVETPAQAAERILATTATEQVWRATGETASAHALATWDWSVTQHDFDRLILGSGKTDHLA